MKVTAWWAVFACFLAAPAIAQEGRAAFDAGDFAAARAALQPAADQGDGEAALLLGRMAENGWAMPRNVPLAWSYYKRSADHGQVEAMVRAADLAYFGRGVPRDRRLAYGYYKRAAEAGNARARGRMGDMAFAGEGRKANPAEALGWLREAAAADDAEAIARLDELAARQVSAAPAAGSTDPAEQPARRVLNEVRGLVQAMSSRLGPLSRLTIGGQVTALSRADGSVLITVPHVSLLHGGSTFRLGTVRLVFRNITGQDAAVGVLLPSRVIIADAGLIPVGSLTFSGQRLSGRWSFRWHAVTDVHAEAVAAAVDLDNRMGGIGYGLVFDRRLTSETGDRADVAEFLAINDFAVHWGTRRQQSCVTAGRVAWWGDLRAVDLTAYARWASAAGIDWRAGGWQSQLLLYAGGGSKAPAPPATAASDALAVDGLSVAGSGRPLFAAKRVDAMLDVSDFGKPYPSGRLSYRHDGGSWHRSPAVQDRTQVSLDVQSLPVGDLVDAIAAAVERVSAEPASARQVPDGAGTLMDDVFAALGRAGTRLSDVQAAVAGEGWEATLSGEARPGGDSMAMTADVAVHGLDAWLRDAGPVLGRAAVQTLRSAARSDSDGDKGPASRFRLTLPPGDRPMVNGYPLTMDEW